MLGSFTILPETRLQFPCLSLANTSPSSYSPFFITSGQSRFLVLVLLGATCWLSSFFMFCPSSLRSQGTTQISLYPLWRGTNAGTTANQLGSRRRKQLLGDTLAHPGNIGLFTGKLETPRVGLWVCGAHRNPQSENSLRVPGTWSRNDF